MPLAEASWVVDEEEPHPCGWRSPSRLLPRTSVRRLPGVCRPADLRRNGRPSDWSAPAHAPRPATRACSCRGRACRNCRGSRAVAPNAESRKPPHAGRGRCRRSTALPRRRCGRTKPKGHGRDADPGACCSAASWAVEASRIPFPIPMSSTAKVTSGRLRTSSPHIPISLGNLAGCPTECNHRGPKSERRIPHRTPRREDGPRAVRRSPAPSGASRFRDSFVEIPFDLSEILLALTNFILRGERRVVAHDRLGCTYDATAWSGAG